jgi:putative sigma-54 modulation protein
LARISLLSQFYRKLKLDFAAQRLHLFSMKLILSTHNVTLTQAIEEFILAKLDKLEHYDRWAIDARVTLERDHTRVPEKQFSCSLRLGVRGPDLFAEDRESDLYAAIERVTKKIEQQIRKRHSKTKAAKHTIGARSKRSRQEAEVE